MADGAGSVADRLAGHLRAGTRLDLLPDVPETYEVLDAEVMQAWGEDHDVDATALRDLLRGRTVADPDPRGIRLRGARIRGHLDLQLLVTPVALELADCLIEDGIDATEARLAGLWLHRCRLTGQGQPAFSGDELQVETLISFASSVMTAHHANGALRLSSTRAGGSLSLGAVVLRNDLGPALDAPRLRVDGDLYLDDGFDARGAVVLAGARIEGAVDGRGARLHSTSGPALDAHRMQVAGAVRFDGLTATGSVRLDDSTTGGHLDLHSATLSAADGPALAIDRAAVGGNLYLNRGLSADGDGQGGAVRLVGTRVTGRINLGSATVRNPTGPGLVADGLQAGGDVQLGEDLTVTGSGPRCALRLLDARVGGALHCAGATVTSSSDPTHRWLVDGLTYRGAPRLDPAGQDRDAWLALLREATPGYTAQPYQQLAAAFRADGHDADVRAVLMRQRRDQIDRGALTGRGERVWARFTGVLLGYGYQPWRALVGLAGVLVVSVLLAVVLGLAGGLDRAAEPIPGAPPTTTPARVGCTPVQVVGAGLDLGTPFLPAARGGSGTCEPTTEPTGEALTVARWLLQTAAWALAALFVTGFTGIVRRT